jgi:hypothetical protein
MKRVQYSTVLVVLALVGMACRPGHVPDPASRAETSSASKDTPENLTKAVGSSQPTVPTTSRLADRKTSFDRGSDRDVTFANASRVQVPGTHDTYAKNAAATVMAIDGDSLNSGIMSKRRHESSAEASLRKALEGFPANCIKGEVAVDLEDAHRDSDKTIVYFKVQFSADEETFAAFRRRLQGALKPVAKETWDEVWRFNEVVKHEQQAARRELQPYQAFCMPEPDSDDEAKHWRRTERGSVLVGLNTHRSEGWDRLNWDVYVLDGALSPVFFHERSCECRLSVTWDDGRVDLLDLFTLPGEITLIAGANSAETYFSPTFLSLYGREKQHLPQKTIPRQIEMSENEVKHPRKVRCEVRLCSDPDDFEETKADFMALSEEIGKMEPRSNATPEDTSVLLMRKMKLSEEMIRRAERNPTARENLRKSFESIKQMMRRANSGEQ